MIDNIEGDRGSGRMVVPDDLEEALISLKGLGELVTSSEWERAALVYAFTESRQGKSTSDSSVGSSIQGFADQGISGLKSPVSVRKYRKAWAKAIEAGLAEDIGPGDVVTLPKADWDEFVKPVPGEKSGSKPKAKKEKKHTEEEVAFLAGLSDKGMTNKEIAKQVGGGMSERTVRRLLDEDKIAKDASSEAEMISWDSIPGTQKVKLAQARRAIRKELERELRVALAEGRAAYKDELDEQRRRINKSSNAERDAERKTYQEGIAAHKAKGVISVDEYNQMRSCLHPDSRLSVTDEKLAAAFRLINSQSVKTLLVKGL